RGIRRMRAGLHPDPRLDPMVPDLVAPDRDGIVEMKTADTHMARRRDGAAAPAVGEQRPGLIARANRRIRFGENQPPPERRADRRDQQAVITPGQAAGDGPARIAAAAVGEPPFPSLRLAEIAADGATESDRTRRGAHGTVPCGP